MSQAETKISSTALTTMTDDVVEFSVDDAPVEEISYEPDWNKWNGYYLTIPEVQAVITKKAEYVIGKGYKFKNANDPKISQAKRIRGCGIDTFNSVIRNIYTQANICGDGFAEICEDKAGRITNVKPICPGTMRIVANSHGIIIRYEQYITEEGSKKIINSFKPERIFHLTRNRVGSAIHGISCIAAVENIILMRNEAMADLKIVFHRYVKPLIVAIANTDDETEILDFKTKLTKSITDAENMVIPKSTIDSFERISIPQYSTLDPLPWIKELQTFFTIATGVPEVVLGSGRETTEASSKILYVGFQQTIENDQFVLEEQIEIQLTFELNFEFPADLMAAASGGAVTNPNSFKKDGNMGIQKGAVAA